MKKLWSVCLILFAMSSFASSEKNNNIITLDTKQKTFTILLKENPTTGYTWAIQSIDKEKFKLVKKTYKVMDPKLIGSGGTAEFEFATLQGFNGQGHLVLEYKRPWEKDGVEHKHFLVQYNKNDNKR